MNIHRGTDDYTFVEKWHQWNDHEGYFGSPYGIAFDYSGNFYVADAQNHIQKFDSNGTFLTYWGSVGSGDGQFNGPCGIAVDSFGNVYVTDSGNGNCRIQKFAVKTYKTTLWCKNNISAV